MKLLYLCEESTHMDLMTDFKKAAAGPFDSKLIHSADTYFKEHKWFHVEKKQSNGYDHFIYTPDINIDQYKGYFDGYFANQKESIKAIIDLFRKQNTSHCEIVATLYYAWKELIGKKTIINDEALLTGFYSFHKKKEKFPRNTVLERLRWMEENNITPRQ